MAVVVADASTLVAGLRDCSRNIVDGCACGMVKNSHNKLNFQLSPAAEEDFGFSGRVNFQRDEFEGRYH